MNSTARQQGPRPARSRCAGFTLIDLLVSLGVIAVLLSLLVPAVMSAQSAAQRVACQSNIRQQAIAMAQRAYETDDELPTSQLGTTGDGRSGPQPQDTLVLRFEQEESGRRNGRRIDVVWDSMGGLYDERYVTAPEVFYCPAHSGEHPVDRYLSLFEEREGEIVGNYQYRAEASERTLSKLPSDFVVLSNAMRTRSDYSHVIGNNLLRADLSVQWFPDTNGELLASLPSNTTDTDQSADGVELGWDLMDRFSGGGSRQMDHDEHQPGEHH
jgi:type II secretory pathway pseudopilin PulG